MLYLWITFSLSRFVDANNQHLPERFWSVTGAPSGSILLLKTCESATSLALLIKSSFMFPCWKTDPAKRPTWSFLYSCDHFVMLSKLILSAVCAILSTALVSCIGKAPDCNFEEKKVMLSGEKDHCSACFFYRKPQKTQIAKLWRCPREEAQSANRQIEM